jgi:hypothetical protein
MIEKFFKYSKRVLAVDKNYTDWLIDYFKRQNQTKKSLVTGYSNKDSNNLINAHDKKTFFRFLQFVTFSQTQTAITKTFWDQPYSILKFKMNDFMDFIQINNKN